MMTIRVSCFSVYLFSVFFFCVCVCEADGARGSFLIVLPRGRCSFRGQRRGVLSSFVDLRRQHEATRQHHFLRSHFGGFFWCVGSCFLRF